MTYRLAIVEDNATARANLRSHLLNAGPFEISSFSNGKELKTALRKQHFELLLLDFHLGESKNGVEWLTELRTAGFIKPSTGVVFMTSDRMPQTIGKIIDCQPDLLLIKPYNMKTLNRGLQHYLAYRRFVKDALDAIDQGDRGLALRLLRQKLKTEVPARLRNDVVKLKAQLFFDLGDLNRAQALYDNILLQSDKVLWAQWGKIKCAYVSGNWAGCKDDLSKLLDSQLARDKAFEWLAGLCFEQQAYSQAEYFLDHIKDSELSVPATRLKTLTYQRQHRVLEGIELLQKKRDGNRSAKERFNEFTFELAEFYLSIAEQQPAMHRQESLSQARKLVGVAARNQADPQQVQKRDILLAYSAVLEDDPRKAEHLLQQSSGDGYTDNYQRTDTGSLIVAARVFNAIKQPEKARELLALAHHRNQNNLSLSDQITHQQNLSGTERQLGIAAEQAFELNDTGMTLYSKKAYLKAMYYFYQAYELLPDTPAFGLNLLQCMVDSTHPAYRSWTVLSLLEKMQAATLSGNNQARLERIITLIDAQEALYASARTLDMTDTGHDTPSGT
ncbi:response regulator [Salinimonas lutimaris]|uniref:response regulator n=1 Tax=Salinimonas lutimaris TaxID=914153 RepID=UPI0010BFEE08|nr:response regulator [Salinimonas lutimaris]